MGNCCCFMSRYQKPAKAWVPTTTDFTPTVAPTTSSYAPAAAQATTSHARDTAVMKPFTPPAGGQDRAYYYYPGTPSSTTTGLFTPPSSNDSNRYRNTDCGGPTYLDYGNTYPSGVQATQIPSSLLYLAEINAAKRAKRDAARQAYSENNAYAGTSIDYFGRASCP